MIPVEVHAGEGPLILGLPHTGTHLPDAIARRLNAQGRLLADTDWHIERLYAGLIPGATTVRATFHRYVIDANRPPSGEIEARRAAFHAPYHAALAAQIARVRARHGVAILYDCHSIRSTIPFLFPGTLPDFNIGTVDGSSCAPRVTGAVLDAVQAVPAYTHVLNGRFKGGWTTRHYGQPREGVHAIQMELAQATHLASETPPFDYDPDKAEALRAPLRAALAALAALAPQLARP